MYQYLSELISIALLRTQLVFFHKISAQLFLLFSFSALFFTQPSYALDKVTLQLKYLHQFQFAGYYAALEQGYYKDAGLDVSIVEGISGNEPLNNVLSGEAEFGVGSSSLLLSRNAGNPVVVLAVVFQHSPYVILMPQQEVSQGIHHIAGQRVMIAAQADELIAYLNKELIDIDQLDQVPHSFNPQDLIDGKVDAFSAYLTNETDYLDRAGFNYQAFSPRSAGIDFYGDNLFTSEQQIADYPQRVAAFRAASMKGWRYAFNHQEEMIDLILQQYSTRNTREHLQYEARQMALLVQPVLVELGYMNPGRWQHIADTYAELGMIPEDTSFPGFLYDENPPTNLFVYYVAFALSMLIIFILGAVHVRGQSIERRRAKEQIEFQNVLLSAQQDASLEGLLAVDDHGYIISANQRYIDLWNIDKAVIDRGDDSELLDIVMGMLDDPEHFMQRILEIRKQRGHTGTEEVKLKDGRIFERYCAPLMADDGQYFGRLWSFRDITERKAADQLIWNQANLDFLTNLPNRYLLFNRLKNLIDKATDLEHKLAVLFLDLDRFKEINDTLGHYAGDRLIQETGKRLLTCVRSTDTIARLGGDEFTVILADVTDLNSIETVANKILHQLSLPFDIEGETAYISTSIGITVFPDDGDNVETLLKNADQAMYAAKDKGRNGMHYFTLAMQHKANARLHLANDLREALALNQFELYYQPIVELDRGHIVKAEALIRWQHPERGLVSPLDFIAIAEENGMINDIGHWVFQQATAQLSDWRQRLQPDLQMSINVSPVQFGKNSDLPTWHQELTKQNLPGSALIVEITEGILMEVNGEVSDRLMTFCDAGINVALDDFGTGYSSLSYLNRFDIDYLKIDKAFVRHIKPNSNDLALCEAMILMAHKLGIKVIAEGVETLEEQQLIRAANCDYAQGYLISKPLPAIDFEQLLISNADSLLSVEEFSSQQ